MYLVSLLPLLLLPVLSLSDTTEEGSETVAAPVGDVPLADASYSGFQSFLKWTPDSLHAHHEAPQDQDQDQELPQEQQDPAEERSVAVGGFSFGWTAGTALLIFAFANTIIIGSTLVVTYTIYQILVSVVAVFSPKIAAVFAGLLALS